MWLCHNILDMKKIVPHVHGPIIQTLQTFDRWQGEDKWNATTKSFFYEPISPDPVDVIQDGDLRRRLILAPRGWYKTSLNVIAHTIQWLLNYPDATILIMHASQETAEQMLGLVKHHFHHNKVMRYFFPEFCAPEKSKEFGTQSQFNIPARRRYTTAPSVSVAGIESVRTGMHYHVIKFTDIVDVKNSTTKEQCEKIIYAYGMARNLLIGPSYWIDVEGTRYNFSDLYGRIVDEWEAVEKPGSTKKHTFKCFTMGCFKKDVRGTKEQEEYTPDELSMPYLLDADGNPISRFPEEFPYEALINLRDDPVTGEQLFASQQLNNPVETENVIFGIKDIKWKTEDELKKIPILYYQTTVDLAETANKRSDYTAITTVGVDRMNRRYVVDIRHGKFLPDRIVDHIFDVQQKWRPVKIKVEETGFTRGLKPTIDRRIQMTGIRPNFDWLQRDTQIAKVDRIMSLQPWFRNGLIFFASALDEHVREQIKHELTRFPKYMHDDILDTLADQFQGEQVFGPVKEEPSMQQMLLFARNHMLTKMEEHSRIYGTSDEQSNSAWSGLGQ
jgi:predicted phage terminase large subunit-like protein